jgi:hypothetical protein
VNAGADVCGGVRAIQLQYPRFKESFVSSEVRPEVLTVGPYGRDDEEECHSGYQENKELPIIILAGKEEKQDGSEYIHKPYLIGDYESRQEGYVIVGFYMYHIFWNGDVVFED